MTMHLYLSQLLFRCTVSQVPAPLFNPGSSESVSLVTPTRFPFSHDGVCVQWVFQGSRLPVAVFLNSARTAVGIFPLIPKLNPLKILSQETAQQTPAATCSRRRHLTVFVMKPSEQKKQNRMHALGISSHLCWHFEKWFIRKKSNIESAKKCTFTWYGGFKLGRQFTCLKAEGIIKPRTFSVKIVFLRYAVLGS